MKFKPEDFDFGGDWPGEDIAAAQANLVLQEWLNAAPTVYGISNLPNRTLWDTKMNERKKGVYWRTTDTHRAKLLCIEPIPQRSKSFCKQGHELTEENTFIQGITKYCRTCRRDKAKAKTAALREKKPNK
jgi:hypothetical protein